MKKNIVIGIIGLLTGSVITGFVANQALNNNNTGIMRTAETQPHGGQQAMTNHTAMSMADMTEQLKDKSGDEFDKAFIEIMISHHEGAIDMAKLIPLRSKHEEIKKFGEEIIAAQNKEIANMKQWEQDWGYINH